MPSLPSESLPRVDGKRHGEQWAVHPKKTVEHPEAPRTSPGTNVGGRVLPKKGAP